MEDSKETCKPNTDAQHFSSQKQKIHGTTTWRLHQRCDAPVSRRRVQHFDIDIESKAQEGCATQAHHDAENDAEKADKKREVMVADNEIYYIGVFLRTRMSTREKTMILL